MNRTTLHMIFVAGFALVAASCSQGSTTGNAVGGSAGGSPASSGGKTSASSTVSSGGSSEPGETGGTTTADTGGSTEPGGSSGGETSVASTTSEGGTTSAASTTAAGGSTKTGGTTSAPSTTAAGGTTKTGGTTGAAGTTAAGGATKTGGTTAAGGSTSAGGSSSAGGTPSSGGATSAGGAISVTPDTITVPSLNGYFWLAVCSDTGTATGTNCPDFDTSGQCPNASATDFNKRGMFISKTLTVGGTKGSIYTINFNMRGVLGTECYTGGTTTPGATTQPVLGANPETSNNGWYMGGSPVASKWNTYEIHVKPAVGTTYLNPLDNTENVYYLNAFPQTPTGWCEKEGSFPVNYSAKFQVTGGGTITLTLHDSNCLTQQNCGPISTKTCSTGARTIDLTGMPAVPTQPLFSSMQQPYKQTNGWFPQWAFFNVTSVTSP